jgi:hypothetical protein
MVNVTRLARRQIMTERATGNITGNANRHHVAREMSPGNQAWVGRKTHRPFINAWNTNSGQAPRPFVWRARGVRCAVHPDHLPRSGAPDQNQVRRYESVRFFHSMEISTPFTKFMPASSAAALAIGQTIQYRRDRSRPKGPHHWRRHALPPLRAGSRPSETVEWLWKSKLAGVTSINKRFANCEFITKAGLARIPLCSAAGCLRSGIPL